MRCWLWILLGHFLCLTCNEPLQVLVCPSLLLRTWLTKFKKSWRIVWNAVIGPCQVLHQTNLPFFFTLNQKSKPILAQKSIYTKNKKTFKERCHLQVCKRQISEQVRRVPFLWHTCNLKASIGATCWNVWPVLMTFYLKQKCQYISYLGKITDRIQNTTMWEDKSKAKSYKMAFSYHLTSISDVIYV